MITVLVTGGTGTTGSRVARLLRAEGAEPVVATRSPREKGQTAFDWADPATHEQALAGVECVYLVAPIGDPDPGVLVQPFIDKARATGVRRVVLLSSSAVAESDTPGLGDLHRRVRGSGLEWTVLRPSWFMQNFTGQHAASVAAGEVVSATGDARVAFVDAEDIAAVAVRALLDEVPHNTDHVITGPEALSYADVAAILSETTNRLVVHRPLTPAQLGQRFVGMGVPREWAEVLAALDEDISRGGHDVVTTTVADIAGRPPRSFRAFTQSAAAQEVLVPTRLFLGGGQS